MLFLPSALLFGRQGFLRQVLAREPGGCPATCDATARWFGSGREKARLMQKGKSERNP
jgi:hypothetical protein